ncbi:MULTISPECIES: ALQxL family class IV lanthipeptide [unclassified Streptomyces]|nr:ALQxL family class IV lanthipeptide [Streptomyces sp. CB02400]
MTLDIDALQELESTEEPSLGICSLPGSCCSGLGGLVTILTCFGCTFGTN